MPGILQLLLARYKSGAPNMHPLDPMKIHSPILRHLYNLCMRFIIRYEVRHAQRALRGTAGGQI